MQQRLTSDRVTEFLDWLYENTDYVKWPDDTRIACLNKLLDCMTSDKVYHNAEEDSQSLRDGEDRQDD